MAKIKFKPKYKIAFDKNPVQFKVLPGVLEKLKTIPDWQERLRCFVDKLIAEDGQKDKDV